LRTRSLVRTPERMLMSGKIRFVVSVGALLAAAPTFGWAQERVPERQGPAAIEQQAKLREALSGTRVGSFRLLPKLVIGHGYDSNIYATESDAKGDNVTTVSPSLRLRSDWKQHALNLAAGADILRYGTHGSEDVAEYDVSGDGRFDLTDRTYLFGGAGHSLEHEDRTSPDDVLGEKPTPVHSTQGHLGLGRKGDTFSVQGGATFERLNYDDVPYTLVPTATQPGHGYGQQLTITGDINNDDRDRDVLEYGLRVGAKPGQVWEVFVQGSGNERRYKDRRDDFGYQRDSSGGGAAVGVGWELAKRMQGEVLVGYLQQNYQDPALKDVGTVDYGGRLNWRATGQTRVALYLDRSVEETTQPGASSYLYTVGGVQAKHSLTGSLQLGVRASLGEADFQGTDRVDDLVGIGASMQLFLYRQVYLEPDFQYTARESDLEGADYHRNQYFMRLGMEL